MRTVIIGAGPVGLYCGVVLARRGHEVTLVDRDGGPAPDGTWARKGVMQFRHPHFFRPQVRGVWGDEAPDLWDAALAAGGVPAEIPGAPPFITGLQCRRAVLEAALWAAADREPGLTRVTGKVTDLLVVRGRASGIRISGAEVPADLVINASGRAGHIVDEWRAPALGGPCGFSYVTRMYRQRPGVGDVAPSGMPIGKLYAGYLTIVFPQDAGTLSTLVVRRSDDAELAQLRHREVFDTAARAIPNLARWTDQELFEPISDPLAGGGLTNTYRGQLGTSGTVALPGLISVGDAVCTTNPAAGRGWRSACCRRRR
jgi:2-polyprenyl-6-methoxyphenol hydroxylase-like FAD-dependent oxidoreductase